jgi:hypothetical protein
MEIFNHPSTVIDNPSYSTCCQSTFNKYCRYFGLVKWDYLGLEVRRTILELKIKAPLLLL